MCRVLKHMARTGARSATPRNADPAMPLAPWVDFSSGYFKRAEHLMAKQGTRKPWRLNQNYVADVIALRYGRVADGVLEFAS